jgi:HPt (histidine-containing phosphotransfer) domain-containing protein
MQVQNTFSSLPVLDYATVSMLHGLGPDVLDEIAHVFAADVPERLTRLQQAATIGGADTVRREAHALKGSALAVGATQMAGICGALEQGSLPSGEPDVQAWVASAFGDARDALFQACARQAPLTSWRG